jgi:hypothetical protein
MRRLMVVTLLVALLATILAPVAKADAESATRYYASPASLLTGESIWAPRVKEEA